MYECFRTSYDLAENDATSLYVLPSCDHYSFTCECRGNMDSWRVHNSLASMGASMIFFPEDIYDLLKREECYCLVDFCDCFQPVERSQIFAFLFAYLDYLNYHDKFDINAQVNYKRFYRMLRAIDTLESLDYQKSLFKAMKSMIKTFEFSSELNFKDFMNEFYYIIEGNAETVNVDYVPDLVMSLKPELIAQVGDNLVSSQCIRDKIDNLIRELDSYEAESFFGVDLNIPENTSATLLSIIAEIKQSVKDVLVQSFKMSVLAVAAILYLVLAYTIIHRIVTVRPRYIAAIHIMCTLAILWSDETSVLHTLVDWCKTGLSSVSKTERVAENGFLSPGILSFIPLFVIQSMNVPSKVAEKVITSKFLDSLGRKISFLGDMRFYNGINNITEWVKQCYEVVKQHLYQWMGLEYIPDLSTENDAVSAWTEKCDRVIEDYYNKRLLFSESERAYVTSLYLEGCKLARHPIYKPAAYEILNLSRNVLIILEKINNKLNVAGSLRNPPVTLMLHGDTGAGKSSLTYPLAVAILLEIYQREGNEALKQQLKDNCHRLIYTRNSEQEFWDGYTGQTVCVFDDWNQVVDSASNPSLELFELIRASNVFPYPLHMSHLDDKASVNFSSDIIICSSNNARPKVESLNFPKALIRRFTRFVHVQRKASVNGKFNFDSYEIIPYDPVTLERRPPMSVKQFVMESADSYMENKSFVSSINEFVQSMFAQSDSDTEPDRTSSSRVWNRLSMSDFKKKLEELKQNFQWLSTFNSSVVIGVVSLIGAGIFLYKSFVEDKSDSSAETTNISDYVRSRKNALKKEKAESYDPVVKRNVVSTEGYETTIVKQYVVSEDQGAEAYETLPKRTSLTTEACVDLVATEMGAKIARSSLYRIYLQLSDNQVSLGHCLFLKGNLAIMPMHFVHVMHSFDDPNAYIYFSNPLVDKVYPTRIKDIVFNEYIDKYGRRKDLVSFQLPHAREHADITNMFALSGALKTTGSTKVSLLLLNCISPNYPLIVDRHYGLGASCVKRLETPPSFRLNATNELIKIHDAWEYSLETQKGDCGAPLFVLNEKISPGKIIGFHVAGNHGIGMSSTLFQEDVRAICEQYSLFAQVNTLELNEGNNPHQGVELMYLGDLDRPVIQPSKSKIVPSVVHKMIKEPFTDLTWLRPRRLNGEVFDPLEYRTKRMGKSSVLVPFDLVNTAKLGLLDEFKRVYLQHEDSLVGRFKCPYSFEETCIGVPGEEFVNAVKRDTSAGFPFTQMGVTRDQIFGKDTEYNLDNPLCSEIIELVKFYEECANEGVVLDHYFIDTLKDERKPIEKCHKTRMFAAGPIDYLLWSKRWFNGIVAIISELRNRIHISVGTNVYSSDWHIMTEELLRKSKHFVAGDFEGFDASEQAYILKSALEVLIEFSQYVFGEDDFARRQMQAIAVGLVFSFHVSGKNVFQWLKSLPSGHYLTAIVNSIFVLLALSSAYLLSKQKQGVQISILDAHYFWENFGVVSYGDDHIIAVPPSCISFYNQTTLVGLLREFGLYYTDELKSGNEVAETRPITEISYLKRGFYFHKSLSRWLAPLSLDVILETPMWIRSCPDPCRQTFDNIEFSLRELSMHKDEVWNLWAPKLLELAESKCKLVSKFSDKNATLLFVLDQLVAQSSDVIFVETSNMRGFKSLQLLSEEEAGSIYSYHTGSAQAALDYPVNLARLRREGALEAQSNSPAETPQISNFSMNTDEVKDMKYQDQTSNDEVIQITTFENDMSIATQDVPMPVPLDLGLRSMHTDDSHHSITSFLKRPMILREFVWDSSQVRGNDIFDKIRIPFDMLVRQFLDKLQGFTSFRATAVINVQFQTQPFQAGRCIIAAVPLPNLIGKRTKIIEGRISNLTLLNHVQADIAKQTEVTLRVPYVSPLIAYDLVQGRYDWAEVVGKVYSPVSSVGTTNIEGIVYVHFEDIQLGAPTSMKVFSNMLEAQAGETKTPASKKKVPFEPDVLTDVRQRAQELGLTASNSSRATGALRKINNNLSEYISPIKPVTDALDKYLLKPIDDFVGPILNIFGFSKPLTVADDKLLRPTTNFSTFHGTDRALTLATSEDINAPFLPHLNGTELDEMSFDYLKKIPQFIDYFRYSTTNSRNDCLYTFYVRPTFCVPEKLEFTYQNTSKTINQPSHLGYITEPFLYWTGSQVLTFKFVKTDYHSGRIEVTYHPNCNPCSGNRVIREGVDFDMAYRFIIDLREKSEVSLRIPYIAVTPFKRNVSDLLYPSEIQRSEIESNSGVVVVRALTPLKASNAVVSNTIEVLVEYNAGNDFQVMNPVTCRYNPITPLENSATVLRDQATLDKDDSAAEMSAESDWSGYYSDSSLEAQSGEASVAGLAITRQQAIEGEDPPAITNNLGEVRADSSTFAVTGEKFTNFRDLCHRTNFVLRVEKAGFFSQALHRFYIPPPCSGDGASGQEFKGFYFNNRGNSTLGYVGAMYALCRGSVNVRVLPDDYDSYISAKLFSQQSKVTDCLFPRAIEKSNIKGLAEFHVPYYCRTYQFDHLKYDSSSIYDLEFGIAVPRPQTVTASAAVSGGDDIAFGYFVGTPVTLYPGIVLYSGGADPFDHSKQAGNTPTAISWDSISVVS